MIEEAEGSKTYYFQDNKESKKKGKVKTNKNIIFYLSTFAWVNYHGILVNHM